MYLKVKVKRKGGHNLASFVRHWFLQLLEFVCILKIRINRCEFKMKRSYLLITFFVNASNRSYLWRKLHYQPSKFCFFFIFVWCYATFGRSSFNWSLSSKERDLKVYDELYETYVCSNAWAVCFFVATFRVDFLSL